MNGPVAGNMNIRYENVNKSLPNFYFASSHPVKDLPEQLFDFDVYV